jgi:putative DNA primase/helicase
MSIDTPVETVTSRFLRTLFATKPLDHYILIWAQGDRGKLSYFDRDIDNCTTIIDRIKQDANVYVGVGTSRRDYGQFARCPSSDVAGIVGLWLDIDYQHPVHKKKRLPPSPDHALALVNSPGDEMVPTMIVHTGHGFQAWWLFREMWVFENKEERVQASELVERWQKTIMARAAQRDWQVDATHDLARVLRVPGTFNIKGRRASVEVPVETGVLYNPSDFEPYLNDEAFKSRPIAVAKTEIKAITLSADLEPPAMKLLALLENDARAKATWDEKRTDLQDDSPSGYDQAMADVAARAAWSQEEIVALLVARRRRHGHDLLLSRADKYYRTIRNAVALAEQQDSGSNLRSILGTLHDHDNDGVEVETPVIEADDRRKLLVALSDRLEITITDILRFNVDKGPSFQIHTARGSVGLDSIAGIMEQVPFRHAMAVASGKVIRRFKDNEWHDIVQGILDACEVRSLGAEATTEGRAITLLTAYATQRRILDDVNDALINGSPFVSSGEYWVHGPSVIAWAKMQLGQTILANDFGRLMTHLGGVQRAIHFYSKQGVRSTRYCWSVPEWALTGGWKQTSDTEGAPKVDNPLDNSG